MFSKVNELGIQILDEVPQLLIECYDFSIISPNLDT